MRGGLILASLLALAACGDGRNADKTAGDPSPAASSTPIPVEPDGGIGDGAGPPGDAAAIAAGRIPQRFQGVWDYEGGTCDPASDLRMEISPSEILFYESIGLVKKVKPDGDAILVTLAMEGEGETWEQVTRFALSGSGKDRRLHSTDADEPKSVDEYPSKSCPS